MKLKTLTTAALILTGTSVFAHEPSAVLDCQLTSSTGYAAEVKELDAFHLGREVIEIDYEWNETPEAYQDNGLYYRSVMKFLGSSSRKVNGAHFKKRIDRINGEYTFTVNHYGYSKADESFTTYKAFGSCKKFDKEVLF